MKSQDLLDQMQELSIHHAFAEEGSLEKDELTKELNELKGRLLSEADSLGHWVLRLKAEAGAMDAHANEYQKIADGYKQKSRSISKTLDYIMCNIIHPVFQELASKDKTGKLALKSSGKTFRVAATKQVAVDDIDKIPQEYKRIETKPDKKALKKAIEAGTIIEGAWISITHKLRLY
jgi:hypothetical protein